MKDNPLILPIYDIKHIKEFPLLCIRDCKEDLSIYGRVRDRGFFVSLCFNFKEFEKIRTITILEHADGRPKTVKGLLNIVAGSNPLRGKTSDLKLFGFLSLKDALTYALSREEMYCLDSFLS